MGPSCCWAVVLSAVWIMQVIDGIPFHHHNHKGNHDELAKKFIGDPTTTPPPPTPPTRPTRPTPPTRPTRPTKCPEMQVGQKQGQQGGCQGGCAQCPCSGQCSGGCPDCPGNFPPCPTDFPTISDDCQKHHHKATKDIKRVDVSKTDNVAAMAAPKDFKRVDIPKTGKAAIIATPKDLKRVDIPKDPKTGNAATMVLLKDIKRVDIPKTGNAPISAIPKILNAVQIANRTNVLPKKRDFMNEVLEHSLFEGDKYHDHHPDKWADFFDNDAKWDTYMAPQLHHPQHVQLHESNYHVRLGFGNLDDKTNHVADEQSQHVESYPGEIVSGENYLSKFIAPPVYDEHAEGDSSDCKKRRSCIEKKLPFKPSRKSAATEAENTKDLFDTLNGLMTPIKSYQNGNTREVSKGKPESFVKNKGNRGHHPSYDKEMSDSDMNRQYYNDDDDEPSSRDDDGRHGYNERENPDERQSSSFRNDERPSSRFRSDERQSSAFRNNDERDDNQYNEPSNRNDDKRYGYNESENPDERQSSSFRNNNERDDNKYNKNNNKEDRGDFSSDYMESLLNKVDAGWNDKIGGDRGERGRYFSKEKARNNNSGGGGGRSNGNIRVDREREPAFTSLRPTYGSKNFDEREGSEENDDQETNKYDKGSRDEKQNNDDSLFDKFRPDQESYFKGDPMMDDQNRNKHDYSSNRNYEDDNKKQNMDDYEHREEEPRENNRDEERSDNNEKEDNYNEHKEKSDSSSKGEDSHRGDSYSSTAAEGKGEREFEANREETGQTKTLQDKATNLLKVLNLLKKKSVVKETNTDTHGS